MQIVDKNWAYGTYKAFADVPADRLDFTPGCRVQPAPFAGRPDAFYLIARYEPGEHKSFPKGGFEVRSEGSMRHSFDLDQVVVWADETKAKPRAIARPKPAAKPEKKVRVKVTRTKSEAETPVAKKAAAPSPKKEQHVCGATKKDGTACQMRTAEGARCRHHK